MSVNFDNNRKQITGLYEVILAEPKELIDLKEAITASLNNPYPVLITRIEGHQRKILEETAKFNDVEIEWDKYQRTAVLRKIPQVFQAAQVAILSGGTSDQPIVEEIVMSLRYFGINALTFPDVGVAGIHRHQEVMKQLQDLKDIQVLIAVAGNEGALFSVVSGQTHLPMVAVPTSIGYGFGGKGETALRSALQSCSPGVVTVNIDNGFGAAAFVKKLINSQS